MNQAYKKIPFYLTLTVFSGFLFFFFGCAATDALPDSAPVLLPGHIQKITVRPFTIRVQNQIREEILRLKVEEEFIRDGRLAYVNTESEADGIVVGEIVNYFNNPLSYDSNFVEEELKMWVIMNLRFIDRKSNTVLWEELRLSHEYRYFKETKPGGITEEEAIELLWDLFAEDILIRTIEGFGTVSGASERKVPQAPQPASKSAPKNKVPERRIAPPSPY